eukprot:1366898-Ditylum_brightwellii.AAC.1
MVALQWWWQFWWLWLLPALGKCYFPFLAHIFLADCWAICTCGGLGWWWIACGGGVWVGFGCGSGLGVVGASLSFCIGGTGGGCWGSFVVGLEG